VYVAGELFRCVLLDVGERSEAGGHEDHVEAGNTVDLDGGAVVHRDTSVWAGAVLGSGGGEFGVERVGRVEFDRDAIGVAVDTEAGSFDL